MLIFGLNSAKSFVGQRVNVHLRDGSVLVNVFFEAVVRAKEKFGQSVKCAQFVSGRKKIMVPLFKVGWVDVVPLETRLLLEASA